MNIREGCVANYGAPQVTILDKHAMVMLGNEVIQKNNTAWEVDYYIVALL